MKYIPPKETLIMTKIEEQKLLKRVSNLEKQVSILHSKNAMIKELTSLIIKLNNNKLSSREEEMVSVFIVSLKLIK